MYSRFPPERREKPIRLPENYSGCAFSANSPVPPHVPPSVPQEHSSDRSEQECMQHEDAPQKELHENGHAEQIAPPPPAPQSNGMAPDRLPSRLFGGHGLSIPIGLSFDELLLIGLILLLSHSENDSDMVLWLVLLLFCK